MAGDQKYTTDAAGFIPYFLGLEPVQVTEDDAKGPALETDFLKDAGGETNAMPAPGETVTINGAKHAWKPVSAQDKSPVVDCEDIDGATIYAVTYLVAYVGLEKDEPSATVTWGSDDGGALYVNGKNYGRNPAGRNCIPDSDIATNVPLRKGVNVITLKVVNQIVGYGGCVRLVDSNDKVMAGVEVLMAPPGRKIPEGVAWEPAKTGSEPVEGKFSEYLEKKKKK